MSARSSARSLVVLAAACGGSAPPEADPAKVADFATTMIRNLPNVGGVRMCEEAELPGGFRMTDLTTRKLTAKLRIPGDTEHADWINPPELDSPAARVLLDPAGDVHERGRAAAEFFAASFYLVYHIDNVNAAMALGMNDPKIGTITVRAIRYDKAGRPVCVRVFAFQNDKATMDRAVAKASEGGHVMVDPAIAKGLQDDLRAQYLQWGLPIPRTTTNKVSVENR